MRKPTHDIDEVLERRKLLRTMMAPDSAILVYAHPEYYRNHDVAFPYRQDTNFYYLTGFEEPESIFLFRPGHEPEATLFVRPKDVLRETWDGFRYGPAEAKSEFKMDQVFLFDEFHSKIADLLKDCSVLYHRLGVDSAIDSEVIQALKTVKTAQGRTGRGHLVLMDAYELVGEMRVKKSKYDMQLLRKACDITAQAHLLAMSITRPGLTEGQIHGMILGKFLTLGAKREGYGSIVASGANATTLHYVFNDQICHDGDLLLIDAGAEFEYYTGDITRTFPVNAKFSVGQKKVYERVLAVQKSLIGMVRPGVSLKSLQEHTIDSLLDAMIELGLLKGSRAELKENQAFKKYYPHGVSHWLGMDVHDAGLYMTEDEPRPVEPGYTFTIEPGLYIPENDSEAPQELRGIGIRIEDNIVVTPTGCEVLTSGVPKEIAEIESIVGRGGSLTL